MIAPKLKIEPIERGVPPRLRAWLNNLPADLRTIIDWVILNFAPNDCTAQNTGGGGGGTGSITVTVEDVSGYSGGGISSLENVDVITFDSSLFELYDGGGGQAVIKPKTTDCGGG
jgi:hypothetical protein